MKKDSLLVIALILTALALGEPALCRDNDAIFQASTIDALSSGVYDGDLTYKELKKHGDFGLGTFNGLDGEMVALEGKFYQIRTDGKAYPADDSLMTPFAVVKFFRPDKTISFDQPIDCAGFKEYLDNALPTKNIFYSIKAEGLFKAVKVRSVPRQKVPYPNLAEALKEEVIFNLNDIKGTIVGFRTPEYASGLNVTGYHFHFITADGSRGGHLLDCRVRQAEAEIDLSSEFRMVLPQSSEFLDADLEKSAGTDVKKIDNR